jgi:cytochrome d ubiquinol oxidase subunit II
MAASLYPYILPPEISLTEAAAPAGTLTVMLLVAAVALPLMLLYNGYQYRVFRGKGAGGYEDP